MLVVAGCCLHGAHVYSKVACTSLALPRALFLWNSCWVALCFLFVFLSVDLFSNFSLHHSLLQSRIPIYINCICLIVYDVLQHVFNDIGDDMSSYSAYIRIDGALVCHCCIQWWKVQFACFIQLLQLLVLYLCLSILCYIILLHYIHLAPKASSYFLD